MEIHDDLVQKLAYLSRLRFPNESKTAIRNDLNNMIQFVNKINELNLEDLQPLVHLNKEGNHFREDIPGSIFTKELVFKNAPLTDTKFFKVPKVIRK